MAISPTGAIIFVSKCWGGCASDKTITSKCGFLDHLLNGDLVLADRGFDIVEDLALRGLLQYLHLLRENHNCHKEK